MPRVTLRTVEYMDTDGRKWLRGLPDSVPDSEASIGVPLGPPSLQALGLPLAMEVALHNQLYARGILNEQIARSSTGEIRSALIAALGADVNRILLIYQGVDDGSKESSAGEPEPAVLTGRSRRA